MSCRTARPFAPLASSASVCLETSRSVCALGLKFSRFEMSPSALDAGCVDRGHQRVIAGLLEQQAAVLGDHPARPPGDVVASGAEDVGDVELVALDRHAGVRHGLVA